MPSRYRRARNRNRNPAPWSPSEDERLREICAIGLSNCFWSTALPDRTFGDIVERRLDLAVPLAPLI